MRLKIGKKLAGVVFCALLVTAGPGMAADPLSAPSGDVILTITGDLPMTNSGDTVTLDHELLRSLGEKSIETTTIWTEGSVTFTGLPIATLLERLGIEEGTLKAIAINDYAIDIPVAEARQEPGLIAYEMNGKEMSVRDKGPLWIVYPFDSDEKYRTETYYSRSIWQLDRIELHP